MSTRRCVVCDGPVLHDQHWRRCTECLRAYYAEYRLRHRDVLNARNRKWREDNHAKARRSERSWQERNRESGRESSARRRARVAGVSHESVDRAAIFERDGGVCWLCGEQVDPQRFHLDHVIAVANGGPHAAWNLRVAHPRCNQRKSNKSVPFSIDIVTPTPIPELEGYDGRVFPMAYLEPYLVVDISGKELRG